MVVTSRTFACKQLVVVEAAINGLLIGRIDARKREINNRRSQLAGRSCQTCWSRSVVDHRLVCCLHKHITPVQIAVL